MFANPMQEFELDPVIERAIDVIFMLHADHE
jgi:citrate synthase